MRRFVLAALLPPANVERVVFDLQDLLFGELDLASAQALPAFAPLAALPPGQDAAEFEAAVAPVRAGFRMELGAVAAVGRSLVLELLPGPGGAERLSRVLDALAALAAAAPAAAPFPLGLRLWLAEAASEAEASAAAARIRPLAPQAVGFSSFEYAILDIEAADGEPWWRELRWQTFGHVRTHRGRRDASPRTAAPRG